MTPGEDCPHGRPFGPSFAPPPAAWPVQPYILRCGVLAAPLGKAVRRWDEDTLWPCLAHLARGRVNGPLFGGVLFEADFTPGGAMLSPRATGLGALPTAADWALAADAMLQPGGNAAALLAAARRLPEGAAVDLWLAVPYPFEQQADFGALSGRRLNFRDHPEDRTAAVLAWMARVSSGWRAAAGEDPAARVRLRGFAWTRSMLWPGDLAVIRAAADWVHQRGLMWMWCYLHGSDGAERADACGFDLCLGRPSPADTPHRLGDALARAGSLGHGLILAWDAEPTADGLAEVLRSVPPHQVRAILVDLPFSAIPRWHAQGDPRYERMAQWLTQPAWRAEEGGAGA